MSSPARRQFLPSPLLPGLPFGLSLLLLAVSLGGTSAATYEYSELHRDVYLDLIGQRSAFTSDTAQSALKSALESYGPSFESKFSACIDEFSSGATEVSSMSKPIWKVYSSARQYANKSGNGYLQQIQWKSETVIFKGSADVSQGDIDRCTRRAFNIGKSTFLPLLLDEDEEGTFQKVDKVKVVALADFTPPKTSAATTTETETDAEEQIEAETANDNLADSELVQNQEPAEDDTVQEKPADEPVEEEQEDPQPDPEPVEEVGNNQNSNQNNGNLPLCPVKINVKCRSVDGKDDCNDIPMPDYPDCQIKVRYIYEIEIVEEIRLKYLRRYRKGAYQGCDNFELCEIRDFLGNYKNKYMRVGTKFDAWEEVCEDSRHDTLFEMYGQMETYYGSFEWVDCKISDDYEENIWSKKETRGYLDLIKTSPNKVESISTASTTVTTEEPTGSPTTSPTSSPTTSPTSSPTPAPSALPTGSPVVSPKEVSGSEAETLVEPEEFMCNQLSLNIGCSTLDGVDCNEVALPAGTDSDPCNIDVKYTYSVKNVGNTGPATFSKLMRSRTGAASADLDFLPYFGESGLKLGQVYSAGSASMTESTAVNFCQPQTQVTVLVAESETARGGECNTVEEYLLITPVEVPLESPGVGGDENVNTEKSTKTKNSEDGFDTVIDPSQVSKEGEGREDADVVTVQVLESDESSLVIAQASLVATSTGSALTPLLAGSVATVVCFLASMAAIF